MSTLAQSDSASAPERFTPTARADDSRARSRRRIAVFMSLAVLAWAVVELTSLAFRHTTGPELYGVLVAALAVVAGVLNLVALNSPRGRLWAIVAVVLWAVVALGGLAGLAAHVIGPSAEHGPVDLRPRPTLAPLVFTALGAVGGLVVIVGRRAGAYRSRARGEE
jgi:4-amino-4-deoxy-L-arabinose transferase-like glycosyltransferase